VLSQQLHLFAFKPVPYNPNWGKTRGAWGDVVEPTLVVPFYTNSAGTTLIRIKTEKGEVLQELKDQSEKGLNYVNYNLSVDAANAKAYEAALNATKKEKETKKVEVEPSGNNIIYLKPGKYTVEVQTANGAKQSQDFVIKAAERRNHDLDEEEEEERETK
jgi:hypothetical protein